MVKLIAMHVGLGKESGPLCSDTDDGSDPDWSPDDDQNHDDITGVVPDPPPTQKRRETDDPLCSENDDCVAERDGIFFHPPPPLDTKPDTFDVDDSVTEYVSNYLYSSISDGSFKTIKERTKNPNINYFEAPMLNSLVASSLKASENKSLLNGDKFLSKTQSVLTASATPIINIWQNIINEKDEISIGELLHCMQQSMLS